MKQSAATVTSNIEVIAGVRLLQIESPGISLQARPGQFVMVRCGPGTLLPRPFSIHQTSAATGELSLLFMVKGQGTAWLAQRRVGEMLPLLGPLGNSFSMGGEGDKLLLVAGGIGIAPLVFLASVTAATRRVVLVAGAASAARLYPARLLPPGVDLKTVTEDGSSGQRGLVSDALPDYLGWADRVYACGPLGMYQAMRRYRFGFAGKTAPVEVSLEVRMGCGIGTCFGCTVWTRSGPKQVCRDGPVFPLEDIRWDSVVC